MPAYQEFSGFLDVFASAIILAKMVLADMCRRSGSSIGTLSRSPSRKQKARHVKKPENKLHQPEAVSEVMPELRTLLKTLRNLHVPARLLRGLGESVMKC